MRESLSEDYRKPVRHGAACACSDQTDTNFFVDSWMLVAQGHPDDFLSGQQLCCTTFVIPFCARNFGSLVFRRSRAATSFKGDLP